MTGRRATKPVYDCKGILSIKFSAIRQCVDVCYRHIRCHETYEERAPPPRRDAKRRAEWEMSNPDRSVKRISSCARTDNNLSESRILDIFSVLLVLKRRPLLPRRRE